MLSIPTRAAQAFAIANDCEQVIIFAHDGVTTHVVTWGDTPEHAAQAAAGANKIKASWNWPAEFQAESAKVLELERRLEIAEAELARLTTAPQLESDTQLKPLSIHVVECISVQVDHQILNGYVAFLRHSSAEAYIRNYAQQCGTQLYYRKPPYIKHKYIGSRECSEAFYFSMQQGGGTRHFTFLSDLSK